MSKVEAHQRGKRTADDPEQHRRFLEAARELGCDENAAQIDEVVRRAAKLSPERRPATKGKRDGESSEP